ncbi:MAG: Hpt domain-containing protein [Planctomycetaceae bacterium]
MSTVETTTAGTGDQAIDLMALLGRCLGNIKMVERVLTTFRATGKSDLEQLEHAITAVNYQAVAEITHRFQGSASNISAMTLRELLTQAERLGREQRADELKAILPRLRSEWENIERFSRAFGPANNDGAPPARTSHSLSGTSYAGASC